MKPDKALAQMTEILLVEDNAGDIRLVREALLDSKIINHLNTVGDGSAALAYLRRQGEYAQATRPDLILLDLNLPKKDGREVLEEIKNDPDFKRIPVVIVTGSEAEEDIGKSYDLHANCYVSKPVDLDGFMTLVKSVVDFWMSIVKLPAK